jgi:hypothetical protein
MMIGDFFWGNTMAERLLPTEIEAYIANTSTFESELEKRLDSLAAVYRAAHVDEESIAVNLERTRRDALNNQSLYTKPTEAAKKLGVPGSRNEIRVRGANRVAHIFEITDNASVLEEVVFASIAGKNENSVSDEKEPTMVSPNIRIIPVFNNKR